MTTNEINEKTGIPLGWAASIVVCMISIAFGAGTAHLRLANVEDFIRRHDAESSLTQRVTVEHELKLQRLDLMLTAMTVKLDEINRKIDLIDSTRTPAVK